MTKPGLILKFLVMNFYFQIDWFVIKLARHIDVNGKKLLDLGAGTCPYRSVFKKLTYEAQDVAQNRDNSIKYIADLNQGLQKIKSNYFDYVLCTQVLEHLQNPSLLFKEVKRVLKPGGKLFLTTNFIYQIHSAPNDFYRFTKYGLKHLGESNGFEIIGIYPQGGKFQVLSYMLSTMPLRLILPEKSLLYWLYLILFSPIIITMNLLALLLDHFDQKKELTINYGVIYQKN